MRVIPPLSITPAMLTSTTVAEPNTTVGEAIWVSGTTYAIGAKVIRTSTHRTYQRVVAGAGTTAPESDPTNWLDVGPTSRWSMFDLERNTGATAPSPLTVVITPGQRIDALGLVGLVADTVSVDVSVGGISKYSYTTSLLARLTTGWYSYFFGAFRYKEEVALLDLPPYTNAVITITLTRASGAVTCGGVIIGLQEYLGRTQYSPDDEALNFSKTTRDDNGTVELQKKRSVPRTTQQVRCDAVDVPRIRRVRADLDATVALWVGIDDQNSGYFPSLLILGFHRKFAISLDRAEEALITLELEEV